MSMLTSSYSTRLAYLSLVGINNGKHYLFRKTGVENPGWERRETEEKPSAPITQLYQVLNNGL